MAVISVVVLNTVNNRWLFCSCMFCQCMLLTTGCFSLHWAVILGVSYKYYLDIPTVQLILIFSPPLPPPPQSLDWCIESVGLLSGFDLLSNSQDFDPAAAIEDIDRFLDENPPPSADNQQALVELAEITENHWAKQNALFAYNRVMEISERFSYHSQILENMVASGQRGPVKPPSGMGLPRIPVSSSTAMEGEEGTRVPGADLKNGHSQVDGPHRGMVSDGLRSSPELSDEDEQTDAASAKYRTLRYMEILCTSKSIICSRKKCNPNPEINCGVTV